MKTSLLIVVTALAALAGCTRTEPTKPARRGWGSVMTEVGRRFELAGRAGVAKRWELAAYEVDEMKESFDELPTAELPKEGNTSTLVPTSEAFAKTQLEELLHAADAKDEAAFVAAFNRAAAQCNACHVSSGHGFIEVPTTPGKAVPAIE